MFGGQGLGDRLYADAVCAQCGTVNPEGTLICKTCGNNLRDQRTIRLAAEQELATQGQPIQRRQVTLGLLTALGIVLVLYVALNVDRISAWMISAQSSAPDARALWNGPDRGVFEKLLAELDEKEPSTVEARAALSNPDRGDMLSGIYVLASTNSPLGPRILGTANVLQKDDTIYFAARLNPQLEVRGRALSQGNAWAATWDSAGVMQGENYSTVSGVALKKPDGGFECFGQSENSEEGYDFVACRLPPQQPTP